jgi:polysaccharide export outer membrane protein
MSLRRGAALFVVLLIALFDSATNGSAGDSTSTSPWWKGRPASSTSEGMTPAFNSAGQTPVSGIPPRQPTQAQAPETRAARPAVRDASVTQTVDSLAAVSAPGNRAYRIGPLDVLDISVFQAPDLSKTVEVADNGTIDLPLLGETPAAGKTAQELQKELNSRLGAKYLQNPQTTVTVKEFNSSRVTITGAVKSPGVFPYKGETLMQYVSMAGGLAPEANSMILVLRQDNGKRSAAKFNLSDIQSGNANDPRMQSGDIIVADTSAMKKGLNSILKVLPLAGFAALL